MEKSKIGWTDHTWNVARGCHRITEECRFCYMFRESRRYGKYDPGSPKSTSKATMRKPYSKGFREKKLDNGSRPLVFACSLTDLFLEELDSTRDVAWKTMKDNQDLIFLVLTKRPERIKDHLPDDWGEGYENVWLGTSVGLQKNLGKAHELLLAPSRHYFLSAEPLIGEMDLSKAGLLKKNWRTESDGNNYLDWVIIGGESGNDKGEWNFRPCQLEWIESLVGQCQETATPMFVKQLGTYLGRQLGTKRNGELMDQFPESIQIREFPDFDVSPSSAPL